MISNDDNNDDDDDDDDNDDDDHSDDDYNCYCMLRVPVNEICSSQMNPFLIVHSKSLKSPYVPWGYCLAITTHSPSPVGCPLCQCGLVSGFPVTHVQLFFSEDLFDKPMNHSSAAVLERFWISSFTNSHLRSVSKVTRCPPSSMHCLWPSNQEVMLSL